MHVCEVPRMNISTFDSGRFGIRKDKKLHEFDKCI